MIDIDSLLFSHGLPGSFEDYLDRYADEVGDAVNTFIPKASHPDTDAYLYGPLTSYSRNGGKRHRPLICFVAARAVGGNANRALSAAAAIEHFHTAALVHDDIADDAQLRRGEPCLHLSQGLGLAINMGDLGLTLVNGTVAKDPTLEPELKVRLITELIDMTRRTIEGQALDIGWARDGRYDLTTDDYLLMATHKTAHYSGAVPLAIGAIAGGGTDAEVEGLRSFGLETGLAFQIQDDVLNLVGDAASTQKGFRDDITEGKRTLVVVHALQSLGDADRDRLISLLSSRVRDEARLDEAVALLQKEGSVEYARTYAENLTSIAKVRILDVLEPSPYRDLLVSMADFFVHRLK
ncbi:polyprenyl synthetase family protein [Berryella wangjianweii]|uniref:Polyprenyl synthetase family protein n=1 Tax=Berryella wangjianweii TaxID=2734634 RepID=A0A6M8J6S6_9ACTN|nr:polyprenyl synthetase family protein [Berryella wangjianweii]NPD32073.1 polyprenyl synthetase family protein [Eggerthellaceae bacterium zg-997]QKF07348.1 polyprenyl synthetase family protein [Berryella wangjianweii]